MEVQHCCWRKSKERGDERVINKIPSPRQSCDVIDTEVAFDFDVVPTEETDRKGEKAHKRSRATSSTAEPQTPVESETDSTRRSTRSFLDRLSRKISRTSDVSMRRRATSVRIVSEKSANPAVDVVHGLDEENADLYRETLLRLAETPEWLVAYSNKNPPAKMLYEMEKGRKVCWFYLAFLIPAPLVLVLAPALETETWPKWHPYCTKHVKTGTSSAWRCQTHFEQSMMFGAVKSDQNTRTYRWINETQGFFLQQITTINPDEDGYVKPRLNREKVSADILAISPEQQKTMVLQRVRVELPVAIPNFLQKFVFQTVAPKMLKQMSDNASMAANPKNPYKRLIEEDRGGLYAHLHRLDDPTSERPKKMLESMTSFLRGDSVGKLDPAPGAVKATAAPPPRRSWFRTSLRKATTVGFSGVKAN